VGQALPQPRGASVLSCHKLGPQLTLFDLVVLLQAVEW
jgi:hypothetical protein